MKKITFLLLAILPFIGFAQTFDFNNTDDGWSTLARFTAQTTASTYVLTTVAGDGTLKNPSVSNTTVSPAVDASAVSYVGVTIKNSSAMGPTFLRFSYPKVGQSGRVYKAAVISNGDTAFQTYWIELTNANWTGPVTDFLIQFKDANGSNGGAHYYLPTNSINIEIDKIEFAVVPPTVERNAYEFNTDGDTEGWAGANGTMQGVAGGNLTFTPNADQFGKISLGTYHVDATANPSMHVTLKNESTNDDGLRIVLGSDAAQNITLPISTSDTGFVTYHFDMSSLAGWTGDATGLKLAFRDEDNAAGAGKSSGTGNFVIDSIIFDNVAVVSVNDNELMTFSIYPNPANKVINFTSVNELSQVLIFDITGKQVLSTSKITNNQVDVSNLEKGIYFVKVQDVNNNTGIEKLLISK